MTSGAEMMVRTWGFLKRGSDFEPAQQEKLAANSEVF
jgi:hypothetical protein